MIRKSKLNVIIENNNEESEDIFVSIASGDIMVDDLILISSLRMLRYAVASQIIAVLAEGITEGVNSLRDLIELEIGQGAALCLHARGESIFAQVGPGNVTIPRQARSSFMKKIAFRIENTITWLAHKTGKRYDFIQNALFASFGLVLAGALIWVVAIASIHNSNAAKQEEFRAKIELIDKELQTAETRALMEDLVSANAILAKAETEVKNILNQGMFVDDCLLFLDRIQKQRDNANNVTRFKNLEEKLLTNVSKYSDGEKIKGLSVLNNEVYIYTDTLLMRSVMDHIDPKIKVSPSDKILRASVNEDHRVILFTMASGGMLEWENGEVKAIKTSDEGGFKKSIMEAGYNR
ncbi:MAG TPA: hypothetical protein PLO88_05635, partial [Bacilli bacterium]|nr:hypothetical protein [Bacilli bacterium]